MGRTPNATPQDVVVHENEEAVAAGRAALDEVGARERLQDSAIEIGEQLGIIKSAEFYARCAEKLIVEAFLKLKEGKKYKDLEFRDENGNLHRCADLDEACKHLLGKSYRYCAQITQNMETVGPKLFESASQLGFRTKDYQAIRALPADDQDLVKSAIESASDRDSITSLIAELVERHEKKLTELRADKEAASRVIQSRDADIYAKQGQIDRLQRELAGKQAAQPPEPVPELPGAAALEALAAAALDVVARIDVAFRQHFMAAERAFGDDIPPNHVRLAQQQALTQVIQAAKVLAADHGVDLPLSAATPAELTWLANMEAVEALRTDDGTPSGLVVPNAWGDAEDAELLDAEGAGHGQ